MNEKIKANPTKKGKKTKVDNLMQPNTQMRMEGECLILISPPHENLGWHMSISCKGRNPTWEEIRDAWYKHIPDAFYRTGAMFFPPKKEYVNVHAHCFHVHEVKDNAKEM